MATATERILIVDDEEIIRWTLSKKLARVGYHCDGAENADEALKTMRAAPSELVILDINMPGKLGTELLPEIRAAYPETAVIMASSVTNANVIAQCIWDGAQDYICKPFRLEDVMNSVSMTLEKRKVENEIRHYEQRRNEAVKVGEIRQLFTGAIHNLVSTLEANDQNTAGHSQRVTNMALSIGKKMGLDLGELDDIHWAALLHDVGKIAVDKRILNKPDKLTPEEYRHIMTHAVVGPNIVKPLVNERVVESISHHHDRYDGTGLDQIVMGEKIPLGARILAVADAFDAMTSDRPYRAAMSRTEAIEEIDRCKGTQFDPAIADTFLDMALGGDLVPA
ncbi:MAG: response regulator [Dehalococcoidales bacterium]|nr:response regulator [Dehalococcoidales bacterium]